MQFSFDKEMKNENVIDFKNLTLRIEKVLENTF